MAVSRAHPTYTYDQYVAIERDSAIKHEYLDGRICAMAGGTEDHSGLCLNVIFALRAAARQCGCRVHGSDIRIYVERVGLATFPDASVICGALEQHAPSPKATALNPTILVEVTSESSDEYDAGFKADVYRTIPTLREYIVVSHRERCITVHRRGPAGDWTQRQASAGARVAIDSLGLELAVDEIYDGTAIAS